MRFKKILIVIAMSLVSNGVLAQAQYEAPPVPSTLVYDEAAIIDSATEAQLEGQLERLNEETSTQIVVVTLSTLEDNPIEMVSLAIGRSWGVGQEGRNNGVVFLIAPNERTARIEVGYGLEGAITDLQSSIILNETVIPYFRSEDYTGGIQAGVNALEKLARGEPFESLGLTRTSSESEASVGWLYFFFMFFWAGMSIMSHTKSWWLGGVFGGLGGLIIGISFGAYLVPIIIVCILMGLFIDYILSTFFYKKIGGGKGGIYFGPGGRGGSSGGFGGFGGGGFGGGGASGRW